MVGVELHGRLGKIIYYVLVCNERRQMSERRLHCEKRATQDGGNVGKRTVTGRHAETIKNDLHHHIVKRGRFTKRRHCQPRDQTVLACYTGFPEKVTSA